MINHSDPLVQSILTQLETQRDNLIVANAQLSAQIDGLNKAISAAAGKQADDSAKIAELEAKVIARTPVLDAPSA